MPGCRTRVGALFVLVATLVLMPGMGAFAQERLAPIPYDEMTDDQKKAIEEYKADRNATGLTGGPYMIMLRTPEIMTQWHHIGHHLSQLAIDSPPNQGTPYMSDKLTQFAIMVMLREWSVQGEWTIHRQLAEQSGLRPEISEAVLEGRRPDQMADDEAAMYDFQMELLKNKSVSDATYARALTELGEPGIIEIINVCGFYTAIGMVDNVARHPTRDRPVPPLPDNLAR